MPPAGPRRPGLRRVQAADSLFRQQLDRPVRSGRRCAPRPGRGTHDAGGLPARCGASGHHGDSFRRRARADSSGLVSRADPAGHSLRHRRRASCGRPLSAIGRDFLSFARESHAFRPSGREAKRGRRRSGLVIAIDMHSHLLRRPRRQPAASATAVRMSPGTRPGRDVLHAMTASTVMAAGYVDPVARLAWMDSAGIADPAHDLSRARSASM